MIEYMKPKALADAKAHAMEEFPKESCGLVIDGVYKPYKNIAKDKENSFKIHPNAYIANDGNIDFVVHSHCDTVNFQDTGHASKSDMEQQIATNVPWCLIHINHHGNYKNHFCWGDQLPIQDLKGRPFAHGIYDCYTIMRDYYRLHNVVKLARHPRDNHFWEKYADHAPENKIVVGIKEVPHKIVPPGQLQVGDAGFAMIRTSVINHCAIYVGNGLVLHHLYNKLSCVEPMNRWAKNWKMFARYTGEPGWSVE